MTATRYHFVTVRIRLVQLTVAIVAVGLHCQCVPAANLHNGLIAYWPLDEGSGDTTADAFGTLSDNGLLRESPAWLLPGDAMLGNSALYFEGFQDVLVPSSTELDVTTNAVTVSAWFNTDLLPTELTGSFASIYDSAQDSYVLYLDRGNKELRFKVTDSNGGTAERPGVPESMLTTGEWHHVMGVYDGANATAKIYYDGKFIDSHRNASLIDAVMPGQIAAIGGNPLADLGNPGSNFFYGAIDDVAVWNRALGQGEAKYLYNTGSGRAVGAANPNIAFIPDTSPVDPVEPTAQPVVYYQFEGSLKNDGTGGAVYDGLLLDTPGVNDPPYGPGTVRQGLDLRGNPVSSAVGGDAVSVNYVLTDNGTIMFDYTVDQYYNYQSLWTNSADANDWEMWIYEDGIVRGRVQDSAIASYDLDLLDGFGTYQVAFTWERNADAVSVKLFIDGELVNQTLSGPWVDPYDTFFIGGGDGTNHYGAGIWDQFRIFDVALTPGEILYLSMQNTVVGDYNEDGELDAGDLDLQAAAMVAGGPAGTYDLNGDSAVNFADRQMWLHDLQKTWVGDADLNGLFDSADFVLAFQAGKYEVAGATATWVQGDWNGDQLFTSADFVAAFADGGYEVGPRPGAVSAVPEPGTWMLLLMGFFLLSLPARLPGSGGESRE